MALRINLRKIRPSYILKPRGKNLKFVYYLRCALRYLIPAFWLRHHKAALLTSLDKRSDKEQIFDRVGYYNKLTGIRALSGLTHVSDVTNSNGTYNCDAFETTRYFNRNLLLDKHFGDWTEICDTPSIVKTRPIAGDNSNNVILKLDKVRHFIFLKDKRSFASKLDKAIFRGAAFQPHRVRFMKKYFGNSLVDCGNTAEKSDLPAEWNAPLITLYDHLKYKFVIALEGTDVASNLKWVMSSNSIAIMPRPKYESWFMEGRLKPGIHYIEIKDDYSDLEEKIRYYSTHIEESEAIIRNAHAFVDQFRDPVREELISMLVMEKYFHHTQQNPATSDKAL